MPKERVRYKTLSPGCAVDVQALPPEHSEGRLVIGGRRRSRPSAGLIVESETVFPVGALIMLDLRFPGQEHTYRSRGMVSWVVQGSDTNDSHKMGVLVFGMDKLDQQNSSESFTSAETRTANEPSDAPIDDAFYSIPPSAAKVSVAPTARSLKTEDPKHKACPSEVPAAGHFASDGLVFLCASNIKVAKWLGTRTETTSLDPGEFSTEPESTAFGCETSNRTAGAIENAPTEMLGEESLLPIYVRELDIEFPPDGVLEHTVKRETKPSTASVFHKFSTAEADIHIEVDFDHQFDSEEKMIEAFEHMHEMYAERDIDGAAKFALCLARNLITCEAGSCLLISTEKYELYVAAMEFPEAGMPIHATRPVTHGATGVAIRTGSPVRISDAENNPLFDSKVDGNYGVETDNLLSASIQYEGHTMGAIELRNSPRKDGFVQGEANLLAYIAAALAEYIHTSLPMRDSIVS